MRKSQKHVEELSSNAEQGIDKHLFKRFDRLVPVQRFIIGWVGLMLILIIGLVIQIFGISHYYQVVRPVLGGIYNEGVRGRLTNINPIYATTDADKTVSKLMFAGLLKYNDQGQLIGDLAKDYSLDAKRTTYTVHLKPNLKWQDGKPLTSADVVYTYRAIQNPDANSPLQNGWKGVVVAAPKPDTVTITLPGILASFPEHLITGIIPQHILGKVPYSDLRSSDFNTTHPVGAGPFMWDAINADATDDPKTAKTQVALLPFADYANGKPKLQKFIVHVFAAEKDLVKALSSKQVYGAEGFINPPTKLMKKQSVDTHNITLRAANMVFFKTSSGILADTNVRRALVTGSNTKDLIKQAGYKARPVNSPLLTGQLAYDPKITQMVYDESASKQLLTSNGWIVGKDGYRSKAGKPLEFNLVAANTDENHRLTDMIRQQWKELGVKLDVNLQDSGDFQTSVANHNYDSLLTGITIGVDPDVFVYWDSSQADIRSSNRSNLSEYKNAVADSSLEAGRTRIDPALRSLKYKPFLQAWQQDNPALALYQPRLLYLTNGPVDGLSNHTINTATDRFTNVQNWQIRQAKVNQN